MGGVFLGSGGERQAERRMPIAIATAIDPALLARDQ
jgi:hypothetical protein